MDKLGIAIVGMGGFAQTHRRYVQQAEEAGLGRQVAQVAIPADQQAFAADLRGMAERGIEIYASLRQMLAAARRRLALVCLPTGIPLHRAMTVACLEAGCHVLVEKPAAGSVQDVDAMLAAAQRAGRLCAVGFQHVYQPEYRRLKEWVCQGRLGRLRQLKAFGCWPRPPHYYARNGWAGRLAVGDAWVLDSPHHNALAHAVNLMCFLGSDQPDGALRPARLQAELYRANAIESADTVALRMHSEEGVEVFFVVSHCTEETVNPRFVVSGDKGRVELAYEGDIQVEWADGTEERFPAVAAPRRIVEDVLEVIAGRQERLACPLHLARAQTVCTCATFESSAIHELPQKLRRVNPDSGAIVAAGMSEQVQRAFAEAALFSELDLEWAQPGDEVDLQGYDYFTTYRKG